MAKKQKGNGELGDVFKANAAVVASDKAVPGGALDLTEVLAWRRWFNERQKNLRSSGGRPTNPDWSMKRQIPFALSVWAELERQAQACSTPGRSLAPGQLAAFLIEEAIARRKSANETESRPAIGDGDHALAEPTLNPRFDEWRMRGVFSGCVNS